MQNRHTSIFLCIIILFILGACNGSQKRENVLKIGMELSYPPFEMSDTVGTPSGISVDLAKAMGKALNKEVEIHNITFDGLIPSLKTGKIDMIISSMGITREREQSVAFSIPYSKSFLTILTSKDSGIFSIKDLNNPDKKIAVKKGTTGHVYAMKNLSKAQVLVLDKENTCVLEVVQGKSDAFLYDQMTIFKNWKKHPDQTRALLRPFQNDYEYWGIAFRHSDSLLLEQVNKFILEYKNSGGFERLSDKYLRDIRKTFDKEGIPFFFNNH